MFGIDADACKEIAEIMDNDIPNLTKISISGAGHLMNMDKPEGFNIATPDFINNLK